VKQKSLPSPISEFTVSYPLKAFTMFLHTFKPSPIPY